MRIWWLAVAALLAPCTVLAQDEARRDPSKTRVVYRVAGTERVKVRADQRFDSAGTPLAYDAYQPATDAKARPAIVFVSGASEVRGWTWYQDLGRLAAAHGMVGIVPDKRYPRGADGLRTGMADTETLLTHLRAAAPALGIDPDRICLWVFSAGGRLAALPFRENAPRIACLVAYYPILSSADLMNDPALLPAFSPAEAVARVGASRVRDETAPRSMRRSTGSSRRRSPLGSQSPW